MADVKRLPAGYLARFSMKDAGSPAPLFFASHPDQKRHGLVVCALWSGIKRFRAGEENHSV